MMIHKTLIDQVVEILCFYGINAVSMQLSQMNSLSNYVWRVQTSESDLILRKYTRYKYSDVCQINGNLNYLRDFGLHIPIIISDTSGEYAISYNEHTYDLTEYVHQIPLNHEALSINFNQLRLMGSVLSKIHEVDFRVLPFPLKDKSHEELNPEYVLKLINNFNHAFKYIIKKTPSKDINKLYVLAELIKLTEQQRNNISNSIKFLLEVLPKSMTHGDFSLSNLLSESDDSLTIIDWEHMGLRPRIWELHKSLLLICGKGICNANFDELNFEKAKLFIRGYNELAGITNTELDCLPYVAEYIAFVHWLKFTLESVLIEDFRILKTIPDDTEQGLWWLNNLDVYRDWVKTILT